MNIVRTLEVPTGHILVIQGEKGMLEALSIGDYGKEVNLKWAAGGLTEDPKPVKHGKMLPWEEKWVLTLSTQYGCSMGCNFCDVPKVGPGKNATFADLHRQLMAGMSMHPEVKRSDRLNIHFARMGEPTWNPNVLDIARFWANAPFLGNFHLHPVISTIMPRKNKWLRLFIRDWMDIKNNVLSGNAGLQLSINSTNEQEREVMFGGSALRLDEIGEIMWDIRPKGRKITLNFAVADYEIDPRILRRFFDPEDYIIKLTPMHTTSTALRNDIKTKGDYTSIAPYEEHEHALRVAGYEVLVFIASKEEDLGRITCGNAILSGTMPEIPYKEIK